MSDYFIRKDSDGMYYLSYCQCLVCLSGMCSFLMIPNLYSPRVIGNDKQLSTLAKISFSSKNVAKKLKESTSSSS